MEQGLYDGFSSNVNGIVESALFNMLIYKIVYPGFHSDKVMEKASKIAEETTSEQISSKATLVIFFYRNQERFPCSEILISELDHMNQERIFFNILEMVILLISLLQLRNSQDYYQFQLG